MFLRTICANIRSSGAYGPRLQYFISKQSRIDTIPVIFKYSTTSFTSNFTTIIRQKSGGGTSKKDEESTLLQQNESDVFGTLSTDKPAVDDTPDKDEGDIAEEQHITNLPFKSQQLFMSQYAKMIKQHLKFKRVKEALDVLEVKMLKEDRVKPTNYIFDLLINECGRLGYSKKAFQLYNDMKRRDLKVIGSTYTGLFNSLANSPFTEDSLERANKLRRIMIEKSYEPNEINYNAMIKAYGRCKDLITAFQLVDEMKEKKLEMKIDTYNFLLQACISDTEYGFRHALLVWHKIYQRNLKPDVYSYNLLFRCVRQCSIGDVETTRRVITTIMLQSKKRLAKKLRSLEDGNKSDEIDKIINKNENEEQVENINNLVPNLISDRPHLGHLIALKEIKKPEDRLLLLGGLTGVLEEMDKHEVQPNIKTFTQLLEVIPTTEVAEIRLLGKMRKLGIQTDVDFFNILIKRRSMRGDYVGAKAVLEMISIANLKPDIVTYGVLAIGCRSREDAQDLLQSLYDARVKINIIILGAMIQNACYIKDYNFVIELMHICKREGLQPSEQFLGILDNFNNKSYQFVKTNPYLKRFQRNDFFKFSREYKNWMRHMGLHGLPKDEVNRKLREHPWKQFKEEQTKGVEGIKNPRKWNKRKNRHYLRKLTEPKLQNIHKKYRNKTGDKEGKNSEDSNNNSVDRNVNETDKNTKE